MFYDYNILFDGSEYYVYADRFPTINQNYDWDSAETLTYPNLTFKLGPSGKYVNVDNATNLSTYLFNRSSVYKAKVFSDEVNGEEYNIDSITINESGEYLTFDEWNFVTTPLDYDSGNPFFSPMIQNNNDTLSLYESEISSAKILKIPANLNNDNVFPLLNIKMNLKVNKPIVKSNNSVTRKDQNNGTVIKVGK